MVKTNKSGREEKGESVVGGGGGGGGRRSCAHVEMGRVDDERKEIREMHVLSCTLYIDAMCRTEQGLSTLNKESKAGLSKG